ncbi:MAG: penicillin acylase family protein [Puniceicoccaceae bacterium]
MRFRQTTRILLAATGILVLLPAVLFCVFGCRAFFPSEATTRDRLETFPTTGLPLDGGVTIYWNDHLVPFVVAETDRDLAFSLGLIHGHLREGQMAVLRKISQGRISEMAGPVAAKIDDALRRVNFGRATDETLAGMDRSTRAWIEAYVEGINVAIARAARTPPESGLLGLDREPFTVEDLLTFGRLAGTDVNWLTLFTLLSERNSPDFAEILEHANRTSRRSTPSFADGTPPQRRDPADGAGRRPAGDLDRDIASASAALGDLLRSFSRSGSNTVAVAPSRSESGFALIANDPHLGQNLPNFWTIVGFRSPGYHAVGLMIPGLPFLGLGRNEDIAWGGTNMRSASSDLVDASDLPVTETREERLRIRFWPDRTLTIRETEFGPILSDAEIFPSAPGETIALRWMGHRPSDEITAFLRANRARSVEEFLDSFEGYAVSGQNMVAVDTGGNIGMVLAVTLPDRPNGELSALLVDPLDPAAGWTTFSDSGALPRVLNPPDGVLASANNQPVATSPPIGYLFNEDERIVRLHELLEARALWTVEDLAELQLDVRSPASAALAGFLTDWSAGGPPSPVREAVAAWDGDYDPESAGAAAFELWLAAILDAYPGDRFTDGYFRDWRYLGADLPKDLESLPDDEQARVIEESLAAAAEAFERYPSWGDLHFLESRHLLAGLPVLGGSFVYDRFPVGGSRETVYKTAHEIVEGPHTSRYGSQSRHISSMEDPDDNWFVLLGGQDGWLGSRHLDDQVPLWRKGEYLRIPLRVETVAREFPHKMELRPAPGGAGSPARAE